MNHITIGFFIIFFGVLASSSFSQGDTEKGKVTIKQDTRIDDLIATHIKINEEKNTMGGFRIQIFSSSSRDAAFEMKAEFLEQYPDLGAYLTYQQPYYKLRIGDFKTRLQAQKHWLEVTQTYEDAFVVKDEIVLEKNK